MAWIRWLTPATATDAMDAMADATGVMADATGVVADMRATDVMAAGVAMVATGGTAGVVVVMGAARGAVAATVVAAMIAFRLRRPLAKSRLRRPKRSHWASAK